MSTFESDMEIKSGVCVVWLRGHADTDNHDALKRRLDAAAKSKPKAVILDLTKLEFITSLAIGEFISLYRSLKTNLAPVYIANPTEYVGQVIAKTSLDATIPVYPSINDAMMAMTEPDRV